MIDFEEALSTSVGRPLHPVTGAQTPALDCDWTSQDQPRPVESQPRAGVIKGGQQVGGQVESGALAEPADLLALRELVPGFDDDHQNVDQPHADNRRNSNLMLELLEQFHQVHHQQGLPHQHELETPVELTQSYVSGELVAHSPTSKDAVLFDNFVTRSQAVTQQPFEQHDSSRQYQQQMTWFDNVGSHQDQRSHGYPILHSHQHMGSVTPASHHQYPSVEQQQLHRHRFHSHDTPAQMLAPLDQLAQHPHHHDPFRAVQPRDNSECYLGQYLNPDSRTSAMQREDQWLSRVEFEAGSERLSVHDRQSELHQPSESAPFYDTYKQLTGSPDRIAERDISNIRGSTEEKLVAVAHSGVQQQHHLHHQHLQRDHNSRWLNLDQVDVDTGGRLNAPGQTLNLFNTGDLYSNHDCSALDQASDLHYRQFNCDPATYHPGEQRYQAPTDYQPTQLNGYRPSVIRGDDTDLHRQPANQSLVSPARDATSDGNLFGSNERLCQLEPGSQMMGGVDVPDIMDSNGSTNSQQRQHCENVHYTMLDSDEMSNKTYHLLDVQPQRTNTGTTCFYPQHQQQDFTELTNLAKGAATERAYESHELDAYNHRQVTGQESLLSATMPRVSRYYDPSIEINTHLLDASQQDSDSSEEQSTSGASIRAGAPSSAAKSKFGMKFTQSSGCSPSTLEKLKAFLKRKMRDAKRSSLEVSSSSSLSSSSSSSPVETECGSQSSGHHMRLNQSDPSASCSSPLYPSMLRQGGWCGPGEQTGLDAFHSMPAAGSFAPEELVGDSRVELMDHQVHQAKAESQVNAATGTNRPTSEAKSKVQAVSQPPGSERALSTGYLIETRSSKRRCYDRSELDISPR